MTLDQEITIKIKEFLNREETIANGRDVQVNELLSLSIVAEYKEIDIEYSNTPKTVSYSIEVHDV